MIRDKIKEILAKNPQGLTVSEIYALAKVQNIVSMRTKIAYMLRKKEIIKTDKRDCFQTGHFCHTYKLVSDE